MPPCWKSSLIAFLCFCSSLSAVTLFSCGYTCKFEGISTIQPSGGVMNKDTMQGNWEEFKGKAKQKWAKLGDTDFKLLEEGKRQEFAGRLQKVYGKTEEEAEKALKAFEQSCGCSSDKA